MKLLLAWRSHALEFQSLLFKTGHDSTLVEFEFNPAGRILAWILLGHFKLVVFDQESCFIR